MDRTALLTATCSAALPAIADGKAPVWVQLFPAGPGSPPSTDANGRTPIPPRCAPRRRRPAPIDYDHAAERPTNATQNTRAAGWIEEYSVHGPNNEPGIWGRVDWTPEGAKAVAAREYRFISPSFAHTKDGNVITKIFRAGLINVPALEMMALASASQENTLDVKKLAAALGLPDTATIDDVMNAIAAMRTGNTSMAAQLKNVAVAAGITGEKIGDNEIAAVCAKPRTPATGTEKISVAAQQRIDDLEKTVATLSATMSGNTAATEVNAAIAAGKITPAQKEWAVGYCSRDPAGFKTFIGNQPVILANGRVALTGGDAAKGELDEDQKSICAQLGVAEDKFKASLAALTKGDCINGSFR